MDYNSNDINTITHSSSTRNNNKKVDDFSLYKKIE